MNDRFQNVVFSYIMGLLIASYSNHLDCEIHFYDGLRSESWVFVQTCQLVLWSLCGLIYICTCVKVSSFFYENEGFVEIFEEFIKDNAYKIDVTTDEMKLEYTELYAEYQKLFEREIEGIEVCHQALSLYLRFFVSRPMRVVIGFSTFILNLVCGIKSNFKGVKCLVALIWRSVYMASSNETTSLFLSCAR